MTVAAFPASPAAQQVEEGGWFTLGGSSTKFYRVDGWIPIPA